MNFNNKIRPLICCISFFLGTSNGLFAMDGSTNQQNLTDNVKHDEDIYDEYFEIEPKKGDYMFVRRQDLPDAINWENKCSMCKRTQIRICYIPYERKNSLSEAYKNAKQYLCYGCLQKHLRSYIREVFPGITSYNAKYYFSYEYIKYLPRKFRSNIIEAPSDSECIICTKPILPKSRSVCVCQNNHFLHQYCLELWSLYAYNNSEKILSCPTCKCQNFEFGPSTSIIGLMQGTKKIKRKKRPLY